MKISKRVILENGEIVELPRLEKYDYLNKGYEFWKNYRISLFKIIRWNERQNDIAKIEKTPDNIIEMAKKVGVKPTARYFGIYPSQVRYWMKKNN